MDNRNEFLEALVRVLKKYTRTDVMNLEFTTKYINWEGKEIQGEFCRITYNNGYTIYINIACDSNLAIIEDILRYLY